MAVKPSSHHGVVICSCGEGMEPVVYSVLDMEGDGHVWLWWRCLAWPDLHVTDAVPIPREWEPSVQTGSIVPVKSRGTYDESHTLRLRLRPPGTPL